MDVTRLAREFRLTDPPADFVDDPYRYYAMLRAHAPIHRLSDTSVLLTRYDDCVAVYRSASASSD